MTVMEFNREKNKIIRENYDIDFDIIPEDQNIEVSLTKDQANSLSTEGATTSCIYCIKYLHTQECTGCPMYEAGNGCEVYNGTWNRLIESRIYEETSYMGEDSPIKKEIEDLIKKFKAEFKG